jgi:hypothetical protein
MAWLEGMLGGFSARKAEVEAENLRRSEQASEREGRIFEALLASPDPDIQALATTGLLESARPKSRAKGLRGWLGELEQSPILGQLQSLMRQPVEVAPAQEARLPSRHLQPVVQAAAVPPSMTQETPTSAALPAQALTEPGASVAKIGTAPPPPPPGTPLYTPTEPGQVARPPVFGARRLFPTQEEQIYRSTIAKEQAEVEGDVAGLVAAGIPRPEALQIIKEQRLRKARGGVEFQSIPGQMPDGTPAFGVFDRQLGVYVHPQTHQPLTGFQPRTTTGSVSLGAYYEQAARALGYQSGALVPVEARPQVEAKANELAQGQSYARGVGAGQARIQTERSMPIGPTAASHYNVSPATTIADLEQMGVVGLDQTQKDRIFALGQVDILIDRMDQLIPQVFPEVEPGVKGALKTAFTLGWKRFSRDVDLAQLDATINAALAQMVQLTGQPSSRISDKDIELARSIVGRITPAFYGGDTLQTAQAKMTVVHDLLNKARSSVPTTPPTRPTAPGAPPPGPAPRPPRPTGTPQPPQAGGGAGPTGYTVDLNTGELKLNGVVQR